MIRGNPVTDQQTKTNKKAIIGNKPFVCVCVCVSCVQ